MTISPVTYSVIPSPGTASYTLNTTQKANESISNPLAIGNLQQQGTAITVSDTGSTPGTQTYNFTLQKGDQATLGLSFGNVVDQATTHIQLYDSQGTLIADNQGNSQQQAAYGEFVNGGLAPGAGNYSLQVAQPLGAGAPDIKINALQQQGTALGVSSQLTPSDGAQFYDFSLYNSQNMKLAFNPASNSPSAHVQIFDSTGHLVADNRGTISQQQNYGALTSGTGLAANPGTYVIGVSYTDPAQADKGQSLKYNFQFYSGTSYSVIYQNNVAPLPGDTSASGSVKAADNAQVFGKQSYHTINETAQSGVPVGYLNQNKTALDVTSLLTGVDATDYYSFVLQGNSNNLKLSLSNLTNAKATNGVHFQLLNAGGQVVADNLGSVAQQEAFAKLTSKTGIPGTPGSYYIKATYADGTNKNTNLTYNFKLFSGTGYSALYRTSASAQTYQNALLSGNIGTGFNAASATASYIAGGFSTNIFGSASLFA